jgi:hypothetical protein
MFCSFLVPLDRESGAQCPVLLVHHVETLGSKKEPSKESDFVRPGGVSFH